LVKPYTEDGDIRTFYEHYDASEYVWHRDEEDRSIEVLEGNGWQIQFENTLPYLLKNGQTFDIEKYTYHRLIKGKDDLIVRLIKL
jgi:hypothetical protein